MENFEFTHRRSRAKLAWILIGCAFVFSLLYFFPNQWVWVTFREGTDVQRMQSAARIVEGEAVGLPKQGATDVPTTIQIIVPRWRWLFLDLETKLRAIGEIESIVAQ